MDASSGHLATPRDLLVVMDSVRLSGRPRTAVSSSPRTVYGEFLGTYAVAFQPPPETNVVVLTNRSPTDPWALPANRHVVAGIRFVGWVVFCLN